MNDVIPATFAQALAHAARTWPQTEAVAIGAQRLTYAMLWDKVRLYAANLRRLGLRRGEHCAILLGNSAEWVALAYAVATLGAVVVPVNTRFKRDELRYCLEQSDARLLVMPDRFLEIDFLAMVRAICALDATLPDPALALLRSVIVLGAEVPRGALAAAELERPAAALPDETSEDVGGDDVVLIQYTSGTTSHPKGVMLTHRGMLADAWHVGRRLGLRPRDRYFSARPLFHVAGTTLSMLTSLVAGATYLTTERFDAGEALRIMATERCTHTSGNDTMFLMMLAHPELKRARLQLRAAWAAATYGVMKRIHDEMGVAGICSAYGLSEASPNVAMAPYDDDLETRLNGFAQLLPGVEVRIVDAETGADQPVGSAGEILVRGWNVMKGYYRMPEQTAKAIDAHGWLHSGDLGVMDGAGRLRFVDRIKDMLRVGGENVAPVEIEDVLNAHPAVRQAQVVGVPDARLVEVPAAYVIVKPGAQVEPEQLIDWCRERCANFKVPRYVRIIDSFDAIGMTASAKVQRNKLRAFALSDLGLEPATR
ncbi:MAG: AMP-binding protein [Burkholderiales bacterium]|nr:AMP-binding protein [Burkholderiales bacterium]